MIKRYAEVPNGNGLGYSNGLAEDESGAWVSLDDYEALEAKNRELALQILATDGQAQEAHAAQLAAEAKLAEAVEALTPSGDTKVAYIGEFSMRFPVFDDDGEDVMHTVNVPWTTIKEIMGAIRERAKIKGDAE